MDNLDDPKGGEAGTPLASWSLSYGISSLSDHVLLQMPGFDKLRQVVLESPTLFGCMPLSQ